MTMKMTRFKATLLWWRRLRVLTIKELLQLFRDMALMFLIVYAFTLDIYIAGSGISLQLNRSGVVVYDRDHSFASRELLYRFCPPYFNLQKEVSNPGEATKSLDSGKAMLALDIPSHFQKALQQGEVASLQLQIDASNSVLGTLAGSYAEQIVGQYGLDSALKRMQLTDESLKTVPHIVAQDRSWYNPNQNDSWFMSIAELMTVITVLSLVLPAAAMVREKEKGTIEQLIVSPLTPLQIILPKIISMTLVILTGTTGCIFFMLEGVFDVPIKGSLLLFLSVTALYTYAIAGIGLLVASFTRNLAQASMLIILILAPMILLSGIWSPPESMPTWLRSMMWISPMFYYIEIGYGILLKGAGINILWDSILELALLGTAIFTLGIWHFKKQFR